MAKSIQYLVIHCTATPEGRDISSDDIRRWHLSPAPVGRGWKQVGYTDMFHLNGNVERLVKNNDDAFVDGWEITNGAVGVNDRARHIVYVGGLALNGKTPKDTRTVEQSASLAKYVTNFHRRFPRVKIVGHNELAAKACPSFDVQEWLRSIGIIQK
ncbi:MAG: lysozyme [Bacteroidia bacterium]|nr:lysozyme [Bacteroidia bacterium]